MIANETLNVSSISIEIQPELFSAPYVNGAVGVSIYGDNDTVFSLDRFNCYIYANDYYPMTNTELYAERKRVEPNGVEHIMMSESLWLPGNYTLLIRDQKDDSLYSCPFTLDTQLEATVETCRQCSFCSDEDVITTLAVVYNHPWEEISTKPGTAPLRRYAMQCQQQSQYNDLRLSRSSGPIKACYNLLITTQNNDLETDLFYSLSEAICDKYKFCALDCSMLYDVSRNNPYEVLYEELAAATDKHIFYLYNIGALLATGGKVIVKKLLQRVRLLPRTYSIWLCGTKQEIDALLGMFPSLARLFPTANRLTIEAYKPFEIVQAFFRELRSECIEINIDAMDSLAHNLLEGCNNGRFDNLTIEDIRRYITEEVRPQYLELAYQQIDEEYTTQLRPEDFDLSKLGNDTLKFEDCISELNEMVGLDDVKQAITTMANNTHFYLERRRRGLPTSAKIAYHCIFTGNPGTGKTTVARKLGKIYRSLGLLSKGEVIAADRTTLVGRYIGETEENMKTILEEARGNVLFIDEAYNLYDGSGDRKDFGGRVIDSLLTVLTQPEPDMLIVFAGYTKEMDAMLSTNPGLVGRFPYKFQFKDYNAEQLYEIASRLLANDAYIMIDEAARELKESIAHTLAHPTSNFGNARWVEQFVRNGIIPAMANRIAQTASDDYQHIEADDVRQAYERFNPRVIELKPRRKVGFSA